jgi:hypothetical protein
MKESLVEHVRGGEIAVITAMCVPLHRAVVTQLVGSCYSVGRAGRG